MLYFFRKLCRNPSENAMWNFSWEFKLDFYVDFFLQRFLHIKKSTTFTLNEHSNHEQFIVTKSKMI